MPNDRFISPCSPPEGHIRELLTILIEEAAEVQQRATKALRFGVEEMQPAQPWTNAERIGHELGDFLEVVDRLIEAGTIPCEAIMMGRENKRRQLAKFMQTEPLCVSELIGCECRAGGACPTRPARASDR